MAVDSDLSAALPSMGGENGIDRFRETPDDLVDPRLRADEGRRYQQMIAANAATVPPIG
jgi:hypothetical protein